MQKLAIIGTGAAGIATAWRLNDSNDITLFESSDRMGGHIFTEPVMVDGEEVIVDTGVELVNENNSPNFFAMLKQYEIESYVAPLDFMASYGNGHYWDNKYHLDTPLWKKIKGECDRFHLEMKELQNEMSFQEMSSITIGEYVESKGYSHDFIYKALLPSFSTFSGTRASLKDFSLSYCSLSYSGGLLSFFHPCYYRKLKGGFAGYMNVIAESFMDKIRLSSKVTGVKRSSDKVTLTLSSGEMEEFDQVIIATHADEALDMLQDVSEEENNLLSKFEYNYCDSVLHTDRSIFDKYVDGDLNIGYIYTADRKNDEYHGSINRVISINNQLDKYFDLFVTLNPRDDIDPEKEISKIVWKHAKLRPVDLQNKRQLMSIQGKNRTWFCGMDTTMTGHEGSFVSGLVVSEALGIEYPFADNPSAKQIYDLVKSIMGI